MNVHYKVSCDKFLIMNTEILVPRSCSEQHPSLSEGTIAPLDQLYFKCNSQLTMHGVIVIVTLK